jgi:hypothetical protein
MVATVDLREPRVTRCSMATVGGIPQLLDELPGVGRHGLHEAPLALGKDDVEGEGGLARAGHAGDDRELPVRDRYGDILEVVLAGAEHGQFARIHRQGGLVRRGVLGGGQHRFGRSKGMAQERRGGSVAAGKVLRRTFGDDATTLGAGFGTDFEDPVGGFQDVEIVLDDDDAVTAVHDALEHGEQALYVVAVQAGRGFVEQQ